VYAHTLCGHEHFANESYEKAISSFREAIALDERHFNAWYGLGVVFFRQERVDLAEYHFRRALHLNPGSSVLTCYLGMVLHHTNDERKRIEALSLLSKACSEDKSNPQLHFQMAHLYLSVENLSDAMRELTLVRELAPKEAPVHSLIGQVNLRMGHRGEAVCDFNVAVSLDPKELSTMKAMYDAYPDVE
jgi:anaphase-promoting complex subunit 3